jgi:hypothetical protein
MLPREKYAGGQRCSRCGHEVRSHRHERFITVIGKEIKCKASDAQGNKCDCPGDELVREYCGLSVHQQ